jgi:hypothetical protein
VRPRPKCDCFNLYGATRGPSLLHTEQQDETAPGWQHLLQLVAEARADRRREFAPFEELSDEELVEVVSLPPSIGELDNVRHLVLYGGFLVRIPPEVGRMRRLREFTPYKSHRLHWLPFEITRCRGLRRSTVSTRALYGNEAYRPPFPALPMSPDQFAASSDVGMRSGVQCSICSGPIGERLIQRWLSVRVGTDVVPLLANACSDACVGTLPKPALGYVDHPHEGGVGVEQPPPRIVEA